VQRPTHASTARLAASEKAGGGPGRRRWPILRSLRHQRVSGPGSWCHSGEWKAGAWWRGGSPPLPKIPPAPRPADSTVSPKCVHTWIDDRPRAREPNEAINRAPLTRQQVLVKVGKLPNEGHIG
jgi:hypothetical protein